MNVIEIIVTRKEFGTDFQFTKSNGQIAHTSCGYGTSIDKIIGNIIMTELELELNTEEEFSLKVEKL